MIVKTKIFELSHSHYKNLSEVAQAMGISVSQLYRVRQGKRNINQIFIVGAIKAFPGYKFDDLFYFAPESPVDNKTKTTVTKGYPQASATGSARRSKQQRRQSTSSISKKTRT